ncbi:MAG: hypothetical protein FWE02_00795 [Defluviitaleaceae bacterium]|nr:hypothetical protein [Defluviitaleaceae bacterium]
MLRWKALGKKVSIFVILTSFSSCYYLNDILIMDIESPVYIKQPYNQEYSQGYSQEVEVKIETFNNVIVDEDIVYEIIFVNASYFREFRTEPIDLEIHWGLTPSFYLPQIVELEDEEFQKKVNESIVNEIFYWM